MGQRLTRKAIGGFAAVCVFLVVGIANLPLVHGQSTEFDWEKAAGGKMDFEVASVKTGAILGSGVPVHSNFVLGSGDNKPPKGLLTATNVPPFVYIAFAYKLDIAQTRALQAQLPKWARQTGFDVEARPQGDDLTRDQLRLMMQSLLAQRFKLAVHFETKDGPVDALVLEKAGKLGSQMRTYPDGFPCSEAPAPGGGGGPGGRGGAGGITPTVDDGRLPASCGQIRAIPPSGPGLLHQGGRDISMESIVNWVSMGGEPDRPVVDRTGLSGTFDLSVEFALPTPPGADVADVSSGTTFLEALHDQLGLKLESTTGPVQTLVIDHIEELSPN